MYGAALCRGRGRGRGRRWSCGEIGDGQSRDSMDEIKEQQLKSAWIQKGVSGKDKKRRVDVSRRGRCIKQAERQVNKVPVGYGIGSRRGWGGQKAKKK